MEWRPTRNRKRGRPRLMWKDGIEKAMQRRSIEEDAWLCKRQWRLTATNGQNSCKSRLFYFYGFMVLWSYCQEEAALEALLNLEVSPSQMKILIERFDQMTRNVPSKQPSMLLQCVPLHHLPGTKCPPKSNSSSHGTKHSCNMFTYRPEFNMTATSFSSKNQGLIIADRVIADEELHTTLTKLYLLAFRLRQLALLHDVNLDAHLKKGIYAAPLCT
ncbi:hypothetical protein J6590_058481 [Homalodisca vitripennis]|nr:hypothetical protein J6590_058481 [Homalodisca vitripennis]